MKILFYSHSSTLYGAPMSLLNILSQLKEKKGITTHLILPGKGELEFKLNNQSIPYSIIPHYSWTYSEKLYEKKRIQNKFLAYLWYYKNVFQKKLLNQLLLVKHMNYVKSFNPDLIYVNSSLAPMGCIVAQRLKIPLVWHHRETVNDHQVNFFLEDDTLFKKIFKNTKLHIYTSNFLKKSYSYYKGENEKVIHDGIDSKLHFDLKDFSPPIKFGIIGRICEQKGQDEVLSVFNNLPKDRNMRAFELNMYGGGLLEYVHEIKEKYNNPFFKFHGFKDSDFIYKELNFVIVNAKNESFGRIVGEANAYGVPVIAINSGALMEIVKPDTNGYIYNDLNELKLILLKILNIDYDKATYLKLSKNSIENFHKGFSIENCVNKTVFELENLLNN